MKTAFTSLLLAGAMCAGTMLAPSQAEATDPPVHIDNVTFYGSGCTGADDTTLRLLDVSPPDGLADQFIVGFDNYLVFQEPGSSQVDRRKFCNLDVVFHFPGGLQFSIVDVRYEGFASLPYGVYGTQESTYVFPFFSNSVTLRSTLRGLFEGNYNIRDTLGLTSLVWSPCGLRAPMRIRTQIYLSGLRYPPAIMTTDTVDGRVDQIYHLRWRPCTTRAKAEGARGGGRS